MLRFLNASQRFGSQARLLRFSNSAAGEPALVDKVLIANRGEIACRVIRTARKMGVKTVAVFSDEDKNSMHVEMADEALCIGGSSPAESYLISDKILDAAKKTNAIAIHPGYGFLSENAGFARSVKDNGLIFVGPPAEAIDQMGSKSASKATMEQAGVPVVPGYHGDNQDAQFLLAEANRIGYPIIIKPVLGGGGKGMEIVESENTFVAQLQSAQRMGAASFGSPDVLIEKYIRRPRHVEVQVFADTHGNAVHLFERDCSVQRRHQKIIEEAPAPGLSPELREEMGQKAVDAARAVNYVGAGTVEFIFDCDSDKFYFMEMNTRLQVEHPVTELITGVDLVKWQLEVASGRALPVAQKDLRIIGHAFEARVYAEDPYADFLPQAGRVSYVHDGPNFDGKLRVDSGVRAGDSVGVFYDPMIAKVIVHGDTREAALSRMRHALRGYHLCGVKTNVPFLLTLASHPAFIDCELDTQFIDRYRGDLLCLPPGPAASNWALAAVSTTLMQRNRETSRDAWDARGLTGLRFNSPSVVSFRWRPVDVENPPEVALRVYDEKTYDVTVGGETVKVTDVSVDKNGLVSSATVNGIRQNVSTVLDGDTVNVVGSDWHLSLHPEESAFESLDEVGSGSGVLRSPLTGKIIDLLVSSEQVVSKGDPVLVMEAMKMEHTVAAPCDGTVEKVHHNIGDFVDADKPLVTIKPLEEQ